MIKIAQGAEAILYKDRGTIIKERLSKAYRLPQLDQSLRQFRTRREAKILQKLEELHFPAPHLREFSDKRMSIVMDFIPGEKLRDILAIEDDYEILAKEVGNKVGLLHNNDLIHGDLTTSNMIKHGETGEVMLIDFGLSSFSDKNEDKAVDLHLLDRALESKHHEKYPGIFDKVLQGYQESNPEAAEVLKRFAQVQKRGRNKRK
ncbi:MAG TPA: KEOPS complex kinase/ATPase Bud32 [Candidatus Nanoarchaeia archaeon]|nr:KEOPS complex kinase/ATPase Bud32 [Candidatus Nanoarchaeia archaeon]